MDITTLDILLIDTIMQKCNNIKTNNVNDMIVTLNETFFIVLQNAKMFLM